MGIRKGFVTVATGDEKYYALAANLLLSYRKRGQGSYPFTLICDRENEYTADFDGVVLVDSFTKTTVDKLLMRYSPYEESILIDADTLILQNIDDIWDAFEGQDDVSVFGTVLPLDSQDGWFTYEGSGKYKDKVKYLISMNGGIYYFRNTPKAQKVFAQALALIDDYTSIDFKYFSTPQDEPLMAMSMILNGCKPCEKSYPMIILPAHTPNVTADHAGTVFENKVPSTAKMIHFSTRRTELFLYNYLNSINYLEKTPTNKKLYRSVKRKYMLKDLEFQSYHYLGGILRKLGFHSLVNRLKKLLR